MRGMRLVIAMAASVVAAVAATGEPAPARPVTAAEKRQAVTELAQTLRARYAIAETAEVAAKAIEEKLAHGSYDPFESGERFAEAVKADLLAATHDKHLDFGVAPPPAPTPAPGTRPDPDAEAAAWRARARAGNWGLPRAEVLAGNVGYLEVRRFQPPDLAGDTVVAAISFLANTDAVIVDLRNCHGGNAYLQPLVAGYFFSRPTSLYDMVFRGSNSTERFWTAAWLPGKRLAEIPMYILTSAYTFSGGEAFAYRFKVLKRATIVGETTGGGANAGGVLDVAPCFRVFMPMGRPVDRDTKSNWEGTGVEPDIKTAAREALGVAHVEALKALRGRATLAAEKARLEWALERAEAGRAPVALTGAELDRLAGSYGAIKVFVAGGQLRLQEEGEVPTLLRPLTRTVFASDTDDPVRAEFRVAPDGRGEALVLTDDGGVRREIARSL